MNEHSFCNDALLMQVLTSEDGCNVERELSQHLEHCVRCQNRLYELTATDEEWSTACDSLANDPPKNEFADIAQHTESWHSFLIEDSEEAWTEAQALAAFLSPPSHPEMLGRLGKYEIERRIGSGGMGIVFKGFDTELNRPVAIKVLAPHLAGSGAARQRFAREARAAAAVVHEHVVPIYSVDTQGETPFLVMQYVAGESLQKRLERVGTLETCEILRIAMQVASGLAAAHEQGIIHRDIKPANILLEQGVERALITDFGLARAADDASLTNTGVHLGTPQYMSPEQARGDRLDARSDLFSLASVMYAMCTGRPPFRAENSLGVLQKITESEPRPMREVNPMIPIWLESIVRTLHAKVPDQRYQRASEVRDLLAQCLAHVQEPNSALLPESLKSEPHTRWYRMRAGTLLFATTVVAIFTWFGWSYWLSPVAMIGDKRPSYNVQDPVIAQSNAIDSELRGINRIGKVVSELEQDIGRLEKQLLGTESVATLLQHEAIALTKSGPIVQSTLTVVTDQVQTAAPGDRIDLLVNLHETEVPSDLESRPVARSVLVLSVRDPEPGSTRRREIALELEWTQLEADRAATYEHLRSFTYVLYPSQP